VTGPTGSGATFVQSQFDSVDADTNTNSTVFTDLLSAPITTTIGSFLFVSFTASPSSVLGAFAGDFRLVIDGTPVAGAAVFLPATDQPESAAIVWRQSGVGAGAHTVVVQWRVTSALRTIQIRPVTAPNNEHGSLYVAETTV
jgi:hypothetical protein